MIRFVFQKDHSGCSMKNCLLFSSTFVKKKKNNLTACQSQVQFPSSKCSLSSTHSLLTGILLYPVPPRTQNLEKLRIVLFILASSTGVSLYKDLINLSRVVHALKKSFWLTDKWPTQYLFGIQASFWYGVLSTGLELHMIKHCRRCFPGPERLWPALPGVQMLNETV